MSFYRIHFVQLPRHLIYAYLWINELIFRRELEDVAKERERKWTFSNKHSLQNKCIETILIHKKEFINKAAYLEINPMEKLGKHIILIIGHCLAHICLQYLCF